MRIENGIFNLRHLRTNLFFLCALSALFVVKPSSIFVARLSGRSHSTKLMIKTIQQAPERLSDVRYKEIFTSP